MRPTYHTTFSVHYFISFRRCCLFCGPTDSWLTSSYPARWDNNEYLWSLLMMQSSQKSPTSFERGFKTDNYVQVGTLLLLFAILRHEREVISNVLLASGNNIHSSCDESEHEADDYDDDDEEEGDRQERNLPDTTKIYFDNYFICHNMPITLFHSLILCR